MEKPWHPDSENRSVLEVICVNIVKTVTVNNLACFGPWRLQPEVAHVRNNTYIKFPENMRKFGASDTLKLSARRSDHTTYSELVLSSGDERRKASAVNYPLQGRM